MLTYEVFETACWPNSWFGGPCWNGIPMSNSFIYYHPTKAAAFAYCKKMER